MSQERVRFPPRTPTNQRSPGRSSRGFIASPPAVVAEAFASAHGKLRPISQRAESWLPFEFTAEQAHGRPSMQHASNDPERR